MKFSLEVDLVTKMTPLNLRDDLDHDSGSGSGSET